VDDISFSFPRRMGSEELSVMRQIRVLAQRRKDNHISSSEEIMSPEDIGVLTRFLLHKG
jgi:hypothetical protein